LVVVQYSNGSLLLLTFLSRVSTAKMLTRDVDRPIPFVRPSRSGIVSKRFNFLQ